jgi:hypothetical protein
MLVKIGRCKGCYYLHYPNRGCKPDGREMDPYTFYCKAMPRWRKLGHLATWSGAAPKWCHKRKEGA